MNWSITDGGTKATEYSSYALTCAGVSFVCYILAGLMDNWIVPLIVGIAGIIGLLVVIKKKTVKA